MNEKIHYSTKLPSGKHWSMRLRRGLALKITDAVGTANVGMVFYNAHNLLERYNAPDTLKCQHTFHLTQGHCLYSDMGRIMASIYEDSSGGHETICGNSTAALVTDAFGARDYQTHRNNWKQNGHDAFLVELAKYGLTKSDLPANLNLFNRCAIEEDGSIALAKPQVIPGRSVHLRFDMDCLVLLHTCPHPLQTESIYPEMSLSLSIMDADPLADNDECLNSCEENLRGFENNRLYHLGYGDRT